MIEEEKEKKSFLISDFPNDNTITYKTFKYFYSLFQEKKEYKLFWKYIQIIIEGIQFISYSFSSNHYNSWKLQEKNINTISIIIGSFRLSVLIQFLNYSIFSAILYVLIFLIFLFWLIVIFQILFINSTSIKYQFSKTIIRSLISIISIIFYIPMTEIILIPIKCVDGKVYGVKNPETCWENMHYLNAVLGIIGTILLFIWCIFMINFSFYPFQKFKSSIRINPNNDIITISMKLFLVLQYLLVSNEYISLVILLLVSIIITFSSYFEPTYNNNHLEMAITIKNLMIIWTYLILFVSKIFEKFIINGFIYLLFFGYPIVIYLSILIYKEKEYKENYFSENIKNRKDFIRTIKFYIRLINSFIERNQNMKNEDENGKQRDIILLKGNIEFHNITCTDEDCPLFKFIKNEGNFNIQRQCLLNYMNILFNKGFKKYPNNVHLLILNIYFNHCNRFNLSITRANFDMLKKLKCNIKEKYIIFCMDQNLKNTKSNNGLDYNNESQIDISEQKYQKLKYLIENSIRLYGEFWGVFTINITSNVNTSKLYLIGEKLNIYLKEINNLWDNELKNKKIGNECQSIVQLYSKFLLEILWDRKKSREVYKKLNDENLHNYHLNDNKILDNNISNENSLESLIDNEDFLLFCEFDEKLNFKIKQCSTSFCLLLGYEKYDINGKSLDIIFPNVLIEGYFKYLEYCIQSLHNGQNNQKDLLNSENELNKNTQFIIVKSKMGYIIPLFSTIQIIENNDYSNSNLIKIKMEKKNLKSEYAYYVLTKADLSIENISSGAIHLGLSLDLLKKYVVKMDVLIRTENDKAFNIYEKYNEYEEEPKVGNWVFPNIIYPKENKRQNKEEEIEELIEKSDKKKFNIQIKVIRFNENENIELLFKFTELNLIKKVKKINDILYLPENNKKLVMFDLLNLNYIRTYLVQKKSGLRNLRNDMEEMDLKMEYNNKKEIKINKKRKTSTIPEENLDDILTKEKIEELQEYNYIHIRDFIYELPSYGLDVGLERFRPNGDKYSASKITEALIKIHLINFCKRFDEEINFEKKTKKKRNIIINENTNFIDSSKSSNIDNYLLSKKKLSNDSHISFSNHPSEDINKGLTNSTEALSNIFKFNSIKYIKILIFSVFLCIFLFLLSVFLITYIHLNNLKLKIDFIFNGYIILNDILYTKYFLTEGVIANSYNLYFPAITTVGGKNNFLKDIQNELSYYRQEFTQTYETFSTNKLCKEYKNFMENTKIEIYSLTLDIPYNVPLLFKSAMIRIPSSINSLIVDAKLLNMDYIDTYELMYNLINEYYINWKKVIHILLNDSIKETKIKNPVLIIMISDIFICIIIIIAFLLLLSRFSQDREKPINLFLTLKKKVFENLKSSAENFSNKLLNKFFGNEDNEEESQQDYQANIQSNDINIAKFKSVSKYDYSIKKAFSYIDIILIIFVFLLFTLAYFIHVYIDSKQRMGNIYQFIVLFNKTNNAQTDFILSLNIFKSYLFDETIPILNNNNTKKEFIETFLNLTDNFEDSIIFNSKTTSFLSGKYLQNYRKFLLGDFSEILDKDYYEQQKSFLESKIKNGLKPVQTRIFEVIRYYSVKYFKDIEEYGIPIILALPEFKLSEINMMINKIVRIWYKNVLTLMLESFYEFQDKSKVIYIIVFIFLIVVIFLYYFIIWKTYEEKLNILLKGSSDLINLIPQEIKNIIIEKIN